MPRIPQEIVDEIVAHAVEDRAVEACGVVYGSDGEPIEVQRVSNVAGDEGRPSPYRYLMAPQELFTVFKRLDETGETLFAIYHSHVASEAYPSPTDVRQAFFPKQDGDLLDQEPMFPETYYVLVSLAHDPPEVRAFHIRRGGVVEEAPIEVA